jgi:hypothetical protein
MRADTFTRADTQVRPYGLVAELIGKIGLLLRDEGGGRSGVGGCGMSGGRLGWCTGQGYSGPTKKL